jgi:uncharacterized protein (UPF0333 family)
MLFGDLHGLSIGMLHVFAGDRGQTSLGFLLIIIFFVIIIIIIVFFFGLF